MVEFMVSAPRSGVGKTVVACALLRAFARRGLRPCAFKCGPDYIDPMFHRSVLDVPCANLDLYLSDESFVRDLFARRTRGHGVAIVEGAMGLFDGVGETDRASAWHVAHTLDLPVLLVVDGKGASLTQAAEVRGMMGFRPGTRFAGIVLNNCSERRFRVLGPMLERETGMTVFGYVPTCEEARFKSRHLGLEMAGEIADLADRLDRLGELAEAHVDLDALISRCECGTRPAVSPCSTSVPCVTLAVAHDRAFSFVYEETLDALRAVGVTVKTFSPLNNEPVPADAAGLYLPGGYPELFACDLARASVARESVRAAVAAGMPTVAECGGYLYLCTWLEGQDGQRYPMVGVLDGGGSDTGALVRFGYERIVASTESLLFSAGDALPAHEFHRWDVTAAGGDLVGVKDSSGERWRFGYAGPHLYAAFPHLYLAASPRALSRWVDAMVDYDGRRGERR